MNYPPLPNDQPQGGRLNRPCYSPDFEKQALRHLQSIRNSAHMIAWLIVLGYVAAAALWFMGQVQLRSMMRY